ncbi:SKP1-like protein 1A [Glycine soja]|uniref:SKP1-like protein 1A n=1 Tax=Glycine soja TaxID=3848 RepID=A0A445KZT5_GLYSO|nr:SKP1-like protein 1A [Glycine soja]
MELQTIEHMIEDNCADGEIPLPNVTSKILVNVIKYCKKHVEANYVDENLSEDELKAWDDDFVKLDQAALFDLILGYMLLRLEETDANVSDVTSLTLAFPKTNVNQVT